MLFREIAALETLEASMHGPESLTGTLQSIIDSVAHLTGSDRATLIVIDTSEKRIDAWRKGYTKGQPDIMILNKHVKYTGLALELTTPACTGVLRPAQKQVLDRLHANGWQTLVSNNYDEICNEIRDYFRHTREMCGECSRWVRCDRMEAHVIAHTAAAEEEPAVSLP